MSTEHGRQRITRELLFASFVGPHADSDGPLVRERIIASVIERDCNPGDILFARDDEAINTPSHYAAGEHVTVARKSLERGPIDEALKLLGLERATAIIVGGFSSALALARFSDLIATVPERHTGNLRAGMHSFPLPISVPEMTVSLLWHPRLDADPAHRLAAPRRPRRLRDQPGPLGLLTENARRQLP